ncbi:class I adenylate-forming enzyme family protein [Aquicoccus porphyridii]|uniref:class I adenylate-forming enzyme family protein n=1 Tax=Aquicoccus porphyridii TaxID=1852029 RepID=UPI00273FFE6E|nr:AMP-binding protein [Aquicoccus porphyridii]
MNPATYLTRAARLYPSNPAIFSGTTQITDYAGFADRAARLGQGFSEKYGIGSGDRVALFISNCPEYLDLLYGVWFAGGVVVPINHKLHPREVAWILNNSDASLVIAEGQQADTLQTTGSCPVLDVSSDAYRDLASASPLSDPVPRASDDLAWLFYTSGTTGRPKGVMISCGNLQAMILSYFTDVDAARTEDTSLYAAPMSHGAGLYNFIYVLRGARHVVPTSGGFDPAEIIGLAGHHGNICMFAAPTMIRRLVSQAREQGYDGTGLRTIVYGGGPMYLADIQDAVEHLGSRFVQIYGQGESPMSITALSRDLVCDRSHPNWAARLASVGTAQSCAEVRIAGPDGDTLPAGEIGEILVRGPQVMLGYWQNDKANAEALQDGWLWTGDMGTMDADGFVTLRDRSKDVIISGGSNIYPREVEEALIAHPNVAEACVVGQTDPEWGEIVIAYVVCEKGTALTASELDAFCLDQIARFKRPKTYHFVNELPKNAYGKVLKTALREREGVTHT